MMLFQYSVLIENFYFVFFISNLILFNKIFDFIYNWG